MKIRRICVLDSMYTLLQYLLLSSEEDIASTYFFFRKGVSADIINFFKNQCSCIQRFSSDIIGDLFYYYITIPFKYPFLLKRNLEYWGVDNLGYEKFIIRKHKFHLLEDGLLSYNEIPYKWEKNRFIRTKEFLMGPLAGPRTFVGEEKTCICRHLTGLSDSVLTKESKTKIDSLGSLWSKSTQNKKDLINKIYGISELDIPALKQYNKILFTQPLSEDGYISEEEKIELYRKIAKYANATSKLLIKPHPREKTDYSQKLENVAILNTKAPFELLTLNGLHFDDVYTIFSTCALNIPYDVNVHFFGSQIHPKLGDIFKNNHYGKVKVCSNKTHFKSIDFEKLADI